MSVRRAVALALLAGMAAGGLGACARRLEPRPARPARGLPAAAAHPFASTVEALLGDRLTTRSAPQQLIFHAWARGEDLFIPDPAVREPVSALDFLLRGTHRPGYPLPGGIIGSQHRRPYFVAGRRGMEVERRPFFMLARLAELQVSLDEEVRDNGGQSYTVGDLVGWAQWTVDPSRWRRRGEEVGDALVVFAHYLPLQAVWTNRHRHQVDLGELLQLALEPSPGEGGCAGTHTLYGMAYALARWRRQRPGGPLPEIWRRVEERLDQTAQQLWRTQGADGSVALDGRRQDRAPQAPVEVLHAAGHHLDWLVLHLDREALGAAPCGRLVGRLLEAVRPSPPLAGEPIEIRAHAAHALRRYGERHGPPARSRVAG